MDEAVAHQRLLDEAIGGAHARRLRLAIPVACQKQQARVRLAAAVVGDIAAELLVESLALDLRANRIASAVQCRRVQAHAETLAQLPQPVERDPAHGFRECMETRRMARFPDAVVGAAPDLEQVPADAREHPALDAIERAAGIEVAHHRFQQLAVDVELQLVARGVADAHRLRAAVSGKVRQLLLL